MKCPHCLVEFHENAKSINLYSDEEYSYYVKHQTCPSCEEFMIHLDFFYNDFQGNFAGSRLIWPRFTSRAPISPAVPEKYVKDYSEACSILNDSPNASAALARRCLQNMIHNELQIKDTNLFEEIKKVIESKRIPSIISRQLEVIRQCGNVAAHPLNNPTTDEIVDVESWEAEWALDIIEALFDDLFVKPKMFKENTEKLNAKLQAIGKPPITTT